ncbi:MAG: SLC13 family permease [Planctomycetota bacterium]
MSAELGLVLALLAAAVVMFVVNNPRMDVVALIMITVLPFTGVISMGEALAGFSDSNIVLIAALFVVGEGLVRTGVARNLGDLLIARTGRSEIRLIVLLMLCVCGLGALMSSTAVTAIFIPVALRISQTTGTSPSRLMMPLCYAALISGMTTLVATAPNLVVNSELIRHGTAGFGFFSFTAFGVPILISGIAYMLFARHWLGGKDEVGQTAGGAGSAPRRPSLSNWIEEYNLTNREHRLRVLPQSPLVGKTLAEIDLRGASGASIIAIERAGRLSGTLIEPSESTELHAGDVLFLDLFSPGTPVNALGERFALESLAIPGIYFCDRSQEIGMAEVIVSIDSELIGKTILQARFRSLTSLSVIGLRRGVAAQEGRILDEELKAGDTLLVVGRWKHIERLSIDGAGVLIMRLPTEIDEVLPVAGKAWYAVICLLIMVGLMVSGIVPNVQAAIIGCLLMGATGCIGIGDAYRCISWKTIVLIVGMLPFSIALQRTGGVDLAADALASVTSGAGSHAVLACLFAITALLGLFISNTATAVLMAPVAIAVAKDLGASPYPFAMIVALAASTAFMTPISSPVNTLVVGPGRYKFGDFVRIGTPLGIIAMIISVIMVPWLLPLHPVQ